MLGEATTTRLHRDRDSHGIEPLRKDAPEGGAVAGSPAGTSKNDPPNQW